MTRNEKKIIIQHFATQKGDTGSSEVQIAIMTERINRLVEHLKTHKKDNHSRRGLLLLVGKRKKLLRFLENHNKQSFMKLTEELGIRLSAEQKRQKESMVSEKSEAKKSKLKSTKNDKKNDDDPLMV